MTRLCFLCGKKIGLLRYLSDQQYCSAAHRSEARLASAQAVRDEDELETWAIERSKKKKKSYGMPGKGAGQKATAFAFLVVAGLLVAAMYLPSPGTVYPPPLSLSPENKPGFFQRTGDAVSAAIRSSAPVTLHHDFHTGLGDWATLALKNAGSVDDPRNWVASAAAPEIVRPGSLRLWTKSISLQNYQMDFLGHMEKRSLSWAFRATDQNNYYAAKLVMAKAGPMNASLERYLVMNGREWPRVRSNIPFTIEKGGNYQVRMAIQDDHFIAYVNGQVVGSWSDNRLLRGGVGFFADQEDPQQIAWVNVSEHDSFMGKLLAHFSFFVVPPGSNLPQQ